MGKITSIYLTDEEVAELKKFCSENQCSQYSVLKTALKELLSKSLKTTRETETARNGLEINQSPSKSDRKDPFSEWFKKLASK